MQELNDYSNNFSLHCRLLHSLSEGLPDSLFGKTLREVYVNMLAGSRTEDWKQFMQLMNLSSAHELRTRIESALATLTELDSTSKTSNISTKLTHFLEQLRRLEGKQATEKSPSKDQAALTPQANKKLSELKAVRFFHFYILGAIFSLAVPSTQGINRNSKASSAIYKVRRNPFGFHRMA